MKLNININRSIGWNLDRASMEITQKIYDGCGCYPWRPYFALLPVKTISGKMVWGRKLYKRKLWVVWGSGFHMEPHVEYADLFEILQDDAATGI